MTEMPYVWVEVEPGSEEWFEAHRQLNEQRRKDLAMDWEPQLFPFKPSMPVELQIHVPTMEERLEELRQSDHYQALFSEIRERYENRNAEIDRVRSFIPSRRIALPSYDSMS